jgi:hypothetical protein
MNVAPNNASRGFVAEFQTKCPEMGDLDFRLLFGDRVAADAPLRFDAQIPFVDVIPPRPPTGFLDDLTRSSPKKAGLQYRYIKVRRDPGGRVVRDGRPGVLSRKDPHQAAIREQVRLAHSAAIADDPVHILVGEITDFVIEDLKNRGLCQSAAFPPELLTSTLINFIRDLNQITAREMVDVVDLAGYVVNRDVESVFEMIETARYAIAAQKGIALDMPPERPLSTQGFDMNQTITEVARCLTHSLTFASEGLRDALVADLRWANANLGESDLQDLLSRISANIMPRFHEVATGIQIGICQLIADHRDLVPSDAVIDQIFGVFLTLPGPELADQPVNFGLAEASLYAILKLSQRFPVTGARVIGKGRVDTGVTNEYDEDDMVARFAALMARLDVIESQAPQFLDGCEARLRSASSLETTNAELKEEDEETPYEAILKDRRMGCNSRQLAGCFRSDNPRESPLPRWVSWHDRPTRALPPAPGRSERRSAREAADRPVGSAAVVSPKRR